MMKCLSILTNYYMFSFGSQNESSVTVHLSFVNFTVYNFFAFEINTTISVWLMLPKKARVTRNLVMLCLLQDRIIPRHLFRKKTHKVEI